MTVVQNAPPSSSSSDQTYFMSLCITLEKKVTARFGLPFNGGRKSFWLKGLLPLVTPPCSGSYYANIWNHDRKKNQKNKWLPWRTGSISSPLQRSPASVFCPPSAFFNTTKGFISKRPEENGHCGRFFAAFIFYLFIRSINIKGDEANLSSGCLEENALKMSEGQRSGGLETMEEQQ